MIRATPELKRVAQRLLGYESPAIAPTSYAERAGFRVCKKLGQSLSALIGFGGFVALLQRALTVSQAEAPELSALQLGVDGSLEMAGSFEQWLEKGHIAKSETVLIAQLLGLVVAFIGKSLVLSLLLEGWPNASFEDWKS